jgi:hypothetical protein
MTKLVKHILKKRKAIIATASIIFLSFLVGTHFHKDELWPFGKGYYAVIKDIKKYGFIFVILVELRCTCLISFNVQSCIIGFSKT